MNLEIKKKFVLFFSFVALLSLLAINARATEGLGTEQVNVYFFWGIGCSHCKNVKNSGVLEKVNNIKNVNVYQLEVYYNQENRDKYFKFAQKLKIPEKERGVPLAIVECQGNYSYFVGDKPIIDNLEKAIETCQSQQVVSSGVSGLSPEEPEKTSVSKKLTLGTIITAALVDSINPCAIGVLLFLIATLVSTASRKRALKYGLIYTFIVFLVYFSAGLGILKILSTLSYITNYIAIFAGSLAFIGGLIEIKDFFWYGKGISLRIPVSTKPTLEKIAKKGTLLAVIILGFLVSLVELPCTGGVYLAILTLMHINKVVGIHYLLIYNFIFVLPLVFIVLVSYYGTKPRKITIWMERNKKWMRLAGGILMIGLAFYLFNSVFRWI